MTAVDAAGAGRIDGAAQRGMQARVWHDANVVRHAILRHVEAVGQVRGHG